jgi:hypothetical protein
MLRTDYVLELHSLLDVIPTNEQTTDNWSQALS